MTPRFLSDLTWTEVRGLDLARTVAILPTGAVEAHGPHLPTSTDRIIALGMAEEGARHLAEAGVESLILPPVDYTAAGFAEAFPGTVSVRPETVTALVVDIARSLAGQGFRWLAVANAHFDPLHLGSLYAARKQCDDDPLTDAPLTIVFPDVTRKPWAPRLTDEFKSGACHAGQYEGSIVLARRPDLVRDAVRGDLPANPRSLSTAIRDGLGSFEEAGGPDAYFGDPAAATAEEGRETLAVLGGILAESVLAAMG